MLTVVCPNCRHRFPAPGCCNAGPQTTSNAPSNNRRDNDNTMRNNEAFYDGGYLLVPRDCNENNGSGCFINAPTIINGATIIQRPNCHDKIIADDKCHVIRANETWLKALGIDPRGDIRIVERNASNNTIQSKVPRRDKDRDEDDEGDEDEDEEEEEEEEEEDDEVVVTDCHIDTSCELTGGTVTITTPRIQSGGCLIRGKDTDILFQTPRIEIRPRVSLIGGGDCFVKKTSREKARNGGRSMYRDPTRNESANRDESRRERYDENVIPPPSGCQELPVTVVYPTRRDHRQSHQRRSTFEHPTINRDEIHHRDRNPDVSATVNETKRRQSDCCCAKKTQNRDATTSRGQTYRDRHQRRDTNVQGMGKNAFEETSGPMEIRVNATVQLPPSVAHCTLNITATTGNASTNDAPIAPGRRDNFNGGGLVEPETSNECNDHEIREAPTTPLSWLMPCPWGFESYSLDRDAARLREVKRLLQTTGWYHEGLNWQQSERLLENSPRGRWLVRDSSDSRSVFAVSVQTSRGPTSVRAHYFLGRFRLDAEPRMSLTMPLFECPIKMLQHYVDFSKRIDEHKKEVWVDYRGQLYSQIYLTKPLVKGVQTLSHLARVAVNRNKLNTDLLPPLIKNYLAEYPYCL